MTEAELSGTDSESSPRASITVEVLLTVLLVAGFFLGPLKLLGTSWFSYLGADAIALLILLVTFGERVGKRKPLFVQSPLSLPLLLLATLCVLELANPEAPFIRSVVGLRSWILYLSFYFVGWYALRSTEQVERLYALLLALGLVTAIYGVYQWQVGPESFATWSDYYGRYARLTWTARSGTVFRAFSTFVLPNSFGSNMALLMLLAFGVVVSPRVRLRWRIICAVSFAAMGVGIAASGSRGPVAQLLLAAAIGLTFIPGVGRRIRIGLIAVAMGGTAVIVVVLLMGPVISERFSTIFDPEAFFWKWFGPFTNGIGVAKDHLFGMGLGYTAGVPQFISNPVIQELPTANIDSGYGSAAAELGFVGLGLFGFLAFKVGVEGLRNWRRIAPSRLRDLLLGPALLAATYPIVTLIAQPQAALPSSIYYWLLIGMLMKAPALQRHDANQLLRSTVHSGK